MARSSFIDQIARRIQDGVPLDRGLLGDDFGKTVRAAVAGAVERLELVSREEFDVQAELLARTRARVEELEHRVAALEQEVLGAPHQGGAPEAAAAGPAAGDGPQGAPDAGGTNGGEAPPR
jgi:hypothetical protein